MQVGWSLQTALEHGLRNPLQAPCSLAMAREATRLGTGQPLRASGLLRGSRQLSELAAVAHPQGAPRSVAELGIQGTAEVADGHIMQGIEVDDDPLIGDQSLVYSSHVPPSPPEIGADLNFQISVRFDIVQLLSPGHGLLGPKLRVWLLLRLLGSGILLGGRHTVPAQGLLFCLWVTSRGPGRDSSVFGLM